MFEQPEARDYPHFATCPDLQLMLSQYPDLYDSAVIDINEYLLYHSTLKPVDLPQRLTDEDVRQQILRESVNEDSTEGLQDALSQAHGFNPVHRIDCLNLLFYTIWNHEFRGKTTRGA